ncbi:trissin receptor isoform X2 [Condylostylus longicornis]|uniref:trissin receptor isoform X2 n=1 Tax=Condylostylus longicornis TaxID=2530218 RepID=UPI00244DBBED|nr:trissin receptor isoform X2 [Condylostylus longicornis]
MMEKPNVLNKNEIQRNFYNNFLLYNEGFHLEDTFSNSTRERQNRKKISADIFPIEYLTHLTNNTNSTNLDIESLQSNNKYRERSINEWINDIEDEINNNSVENTATPSPTFFNNSSTKQTELIENAFKNVNDSIKNTDIKQNVKETLKSTLSYGYTTILNFLNSLETATSYPTSNITNNFIQSLHNSSSNVTITSFNEFMNLNRSYYRHLPPSLLSGHEFLVGIDSYGSQLNNINSINNENDVSIMSKNNNDFGVVVGSYINSTIVNNLNDFLLNNSTDEQYIIKLHETNNELDENDELFAPGAKRDFVFDRTDVKIIFITLYSLVFCCCFFAVADFCVGVFCVMQNLTIYLIDSWVFGKFLCKMYQFVHSLSYTASIFILVVICMERYFAIIHPITCKQILTPSRLRLVILGVWITSAVYSTPKFIFSKTITNIHTINGIEEDICILDRQMFNSEILDLINFGFLYVIPLLVMTILYSRIAIALWKSSRGLERHIALQNTSTSSPSYSGAYLYRKQCNMKFEKQQRVTPAGVSESQVSMEAERAVVSTWKKPNSFHQRHGTQVAQISNSTNNVLRARRGVIRMLIIVVLTFALCNLPYHARKMWIYWSDTYKGYSNFNALFTPLTFLATYFNSGVNPLLYAFLSRNFRKGMRELIMCSFKKNKNKSSSMHQRIPLQEVASVVLQAVNIPLGKLNAGTENFDQPTTVKTMQVKASNNDLQGISEI